VTDDILAALRRMDLIAGDERPAVSALAGGVSSDIFRVDLNDGPICIKRALARLKVAAEWYAPIERNAAEVAWMRFAGAVVPGSVPEILGEDPSGQMFAMKYLDPDEFPVWKNQLRDGVIDPAAARAVGERLARIHAASARDRALAPRFANHATFHAIRIEPYLLATAEARPECATALRRLATTTESTRLTLVHGDVSPKNILIGPDGPVFLDAECATWGDAAFDLAFCLNHMLLKCLWRPHWKDRYLDCFAALAGAYLAGADWEPKESLEARTAALLPGLLLGRIDGKSPVEYVTDEADRNRTRGFAAALLNNPVPRLDMVSQGWANA
jgi:aminoglycoside phosphotransferase (APT) family kinase protein